MKGVNSRDGWQSARLVCGTLGVRPLYLQDRFKVENITKTIDKGSLEMYNKGRCYD